MLTGAQAEAVQDGEAGAGEGEQKREWQITMPHIPADTWILIAALLLLVIAFLIRRTRRKPCEPNQQWQIKRVRRHHRKHKREQRRIMHSQRGDK